MSQGIGIQYTSTSYLFHKPLKVAGALIRPKAMQSHSKKPRGLTEKAVFCFQLL